MFSSKFDVDQIPKRKSVTWSKGCVWNRRLCRRSLFVGCFFVRLRVSFLELQMMSFEGSKSNQKWKLQGMRREESHCGGNLVFFAVRTMPLVFHKPPLPLRKTHWTLLVYFPETDFTTWRQTTEGGRDAYNSSSTPNFRPKTAVVVVQRNLSVR